MSLRVKINILITLLMLVFIGSTTAIQLRDAKRKFRKKSQQEQKLPINFSHIFLLGHNYCHRKRQRRRIKNFLKNLGRIRRMKYACSIALVISFMTLLLASIKLEETHPIGFQTSSLQNRTIYNSSTSVDCASHTKSLPSNFRCLG